MSAKPASGRTGRGARVAGLTAREAEVLRLLHANRNKLNTPYTRGEAEPGWCRPLDLGGTQQSHHSNTLGRLNRLGYVDKKPYLGATTHSSIYRISEAGVAAWDIYAEHQRRLRSTSAVPASPSLQQTATLSLMTN
jgi:hypothetical protein